MVGAAEAGDSDPAVGIEAVDRLEQRQRCDLREVVQGFVRVAVAGSEAAREGEQPGGDLVTCRHVPVAVVALEESVLVRV